MLIKESQLRAIIREELILENIDILYEAGFMSKIAKHGKAFGLGMLFFLIAGGYLNPSKAFGKKFHDLYVQDEAKSAVIKLVKVKKRIGDKGLKKLKDSIEYKELSKKLDEALKKLDDAFTKRDKLNKEIDDNYAKVNDKQRKQYDELEVKAQENISKANKELQKVKKEYDDFCQKVIDAPDLDLAKSAESELDYLEGK